jgi:hypothetical protein
VARVAKITVTQAEESALRAAAEVVGGLESLVAKVTAARSPAPSAAPGPSATAFTERLRATRKSAIPTKAAPGYYARVAQLLSQQGATPEDTELLCRWIDRQGWLQGGVTPMQAAQKYSEWLARARRDGAPASTSGGGAPCALGDV